MSHKRSWVIGGEPSCDLIVDLPSVSGQHCRLREVGENDFEVEDLGSTNGTFVNGRPIRVPTRISKADHVTLGRSVPMPWPSIKPSRGSPIVLSIGRDPESDIVLDEPMVSSSHARLLLNDSGAIIEDLGSSNGTYLNSLDQPITKAPLAGVDTVYFGSLAIPTAKLLSLAKNRVNNPNQAPSIKTAGSNLSSGSGSVVVLGGGDMILGRDPACDQVLDFPMVSGRHARIWRSGGAIYVEDLGSSNGTFVNGKRLSRRPLAIGQDDVIGLGSYTFRLTDAGQLQRRDYQGRIALEARQISVDIHKQPLLDNISMTIYPGEFVGLMGPAGAGKSTLLKALNGYRAPSSGAVLLNGVDLYRHYGHYRGHIGYVPQDDIIHRDLTVGQALRFAARLRLPSDFDKDDIERRVNAVLQQLGLERIKHRLIGSPTRGAISGGERKRVNLAMELLADPSVLFLDEPTSGLSSEDTLVVMQLLRRLADTGKTILLTIHQPGLDSFRLLDQLAVIAKESGGGPGRLAYYGPAYPGAIEFFNQDSRPGSNPSPDEVLRGLAQEPVASWVRRFASSPIHRQFVEERAGTLPEGSEEIAPSLADRGIGLTQWWTLACRNLAIKARDRWNTMILLAQAPIVALLIVLVFGRNAAVEATNDNWPSVARMVGSTTFVMALSAIWFGCSNAIREIVGEWSIYQRERMIHLKLVPYIGSKFLILGAFGFLQSLILLVIVSQGSNLQGPFLPMLGILTLAALVGAGLGLVISALARTSEMAIALLPLVILPLLLLGGALQPRHDLPSPVREFADVFPSRWAFEGIVLLEADRQPTWKAPILPKFLQMGRGSEASGNPSGPTIQDMAEHYFPAETERMGVRASVLALGTILVGLIGLVLATLRQRDIH